jgi:uncharacterized membrane protein
MRGMRASNRIVVPVPPGVVWSVFTDVERWPTWTRSVTSVEPLDGPGIEPGHRFRLRQPRMPVLVWEVTDVQPGRSWRWAARSPGARTEAGHEVVPDGDAGSLVTQVVEQRGPLAAVAGPFVRPMVVRYMGWEAEGLQRASVERARGGRPG